MPHPAVVPRRPEHTLAAYREAVRQGADFVEPDLVLTKDGVPIARHEPLLGAIAVNGVALPRVNEYTTTDVLTRPAFAGRLRTRTLNGVRITGFWSDDFTLAEVRTLRARERIPALRPGNVAYHDQEPIPTLQEVVDLAKREGAAAGRRRSARVPASCLPAPAPPHQECVHASFPPPPGPPRGRRAARRCCCRL